MITVEDLMLYNVRWEKPITAQFVNFFDVKEILQQQNNIDKYNFIR